MAYWKSLNRKRPGQRGRQVQTEPLPNPDLIPVWLEAIDGDVEHREYRNRFQKLFAGSEPALSGLKEIYDECSVYSHANPFGAGDFVREEGHSFGVVYFDRTDPGSLSHAFWITVDGHWLIISLMLPIFKGFMTKEKLGLLLQTFIDVAGVASRGDSGEGDKLLQSVISTLVH